MNRKCKKTGIFIGLTMAITGMTACGETEPEETPVVKEETANQQKHRHQLQRRLPHRPRFLIYRL